MRLHWIIACLLWIFTVPGLSLDSDDPRDIYTLLWQIGEHDNDNSEFNLAPNRFSQYDRPGIHLVGVSDPDETWPYILPGELDTWAGTGLQAFEILFTLEKLPPGGECRLLLDFLDTHSFKPPRLSVQVNHQVFEHQTQSGNNDWLMAAPDGSGREYLASFQIPVLALNEGENSITITATEGSWALWDAISFEVPKGLVSGSPRPGTAIRSIQQKQLLVQKGDTLWKPLALEIMHSEKERKAFIRSSVSPPVAMDLSPGIQIVELWIPETGEQEEVMIEVYSGNELFTRNITLVQPVRKWEVHLIHQTHLDIGFTHTQEEVLELQTGYLDQALDLIEETKDYPEEARFRWHPEGMWAIDEYLQSASEEKKEQFMEALQQQNIHLDAFYVHLLTGLATGEELFQLIQPAKEFERKYGIPVKTAIGSDIPGYSWGLVTAMAHQGIKFFNMAPNNNHRLGRLYHWADKPFYWLSPDGHQRVLTWMASHAYIYFWELYEGLNRVPRFLSYLEKSKFPYDIAMLRYEIGGDNGHPDPSLPGKIKAWNEKYAYPKIILSTNSRLYDAFSGKYEDVIPVVSGDLTPYWEDGATSTAADLAISRAAGERLLQSQALQAMLKPGVQDVGFTSDAWNNIIMYDEHTWGAFCSITDPFDPFTVSQEQYKQQFALNAERLTRELEEEAVRDIHEPGSGVIDVYNTSSWMRDDLVMLSPDQSAAGDRVMDDHGQAVVSQRLASGNLAFRAEEVPAYGVRRYKIVEGTAVESHGMSIGGNEISNEMLSIKIDDGTGAIESVVIKSSGRELVDPSGYLLNEYVYMQGREAGKNISGADSPVTITVEDAGPLVGALRVESGAPGCEKLTRRVSLIQGEARIDIVNTVDKLKVLEPEGVYFAFPLNIPGGLARIDIPWGVIRPETDQLPGANRNYYALQRWMDISNDRFGMTWVSMDAPMIKFSPVKIVGKGRGDSQYMAEFGREGIRTWWNESINPAQSYLSWVMNNHWEVNYKAYQEGEVTFRYTLFPHEGTYHGIEAEKRGRGICQPLLALEVNQDTEVMAPPFTLAGDLVATSLKSNRDGDGFLLRLYNPDSAVREIQITGTDGKPLHIHHCDPSGKPFRPAGKRIELPGYGVGTVRIALPADHVKY